MPGVELGTTPDGRLAVPTCPWLMRKLPVKRDQLMPCWYSLLRRTSMMVASISTCRLTLCCTISMNSATFSCWRPVARTAIRPPSTLTTTEDGLPLLASFNSGKPFASSGMPPPPAWLRALWPAGGLRLFSGDVLLPACVALGLLLCGGTGTLANCWFNRASGSVSGSLSVVSRKRSRILRSRLYQKLFSERFTTRVVELLLPLPPTTGLLVLPVLLPLLTLPLLLAPPPAVEICVAMLTLLLVLRAMLT